MEKTTYEIPECSTVRVELNCRLLNGSSENYGVDGFDPSFDENEGN